MELSLERGMEGDSRAESRIFRLSIDPGSPSGAKQHNENLSETMLPLLPRRGYGVGVKSTCQVTICRKVHNNPREECSRRDLNPKPSDP